MWKLLIVFAIGALVACQRNTTNQESKIDANIIALEDSIRLYRQKAFESEKIKLENAAELLKEIEQSIPIYDKTLWIETQQKLASMREAMYDSISMGDEKVMDNYDRKTAEMLSSLERLIQKTPDFYKYARAKLLYEEIKFYDNSDFKIRKEYNAYASEYNDLIRKGKISGKKVILFWGEPTI
ncbi:MAG: hypothetical protein NZM38_02045 [Cytophagales bacterium]|nr:hypothetical protein [Cytophagales bacterium]MDW8383533.1 hypothetical protein [Flammeovirgaceae bacterium]